jgi:hypothetical protein
MRMAAFWPTRSPTGEVVKVGCGSVDSRLSRRNIRDLAASLKTPQFSASNRRCKYLELCNAGFLFSRE